MGRCIIDRCLLCLPVIWRHTDTDVNVLCQINGLVLFISLIIDFEVIVTVIREHDVNCVAGGRWGSQLPEPDIQDMLYITWISC